VAVIARFRYHSNGDIFSKSYSNLSDTSDHFQKQQYQLRNVQTQGMASGSGVSFLLNLQYIAAREIVIKLI